MQALKVLLAVVLVLVALIAAQYARGRAGQMPNRPHAVELPR
jgi:hypothetical protein